MLSANNDIFQSKQSTLPSPPIHQHTMTGEQHKYCCAIIRNLKRHRDATPFLAPVDHIKLNVPDYYTVITHPMDLQKVDKKLNNMEYNTVEDFVADVRLIFSNCFKYNGPDATVSLLCQNVESAFEKGLKQMPSVAPTTPKGMAESPAKKEPSPPLSQHSSPPPLSQSINKPEESTRPKREIHCPSKDYPETFTTQKKMSSNSPMRFCLQALKELKKAKYRNIAYPFMEPVDPVALNLPDYTSIVKHPMDLSTIEKKLMNDEYEDPEAFESDVTLMFNNCYLYNPPTLPIYSMAQELQKVFREKWAQKPTEHRKVAQKRPQQKRRSTEEQEDASVVDDSDDKIAELERHIASISQQIQSIKSSKKSTSGTSTPAPKARRGRGPNKNPAKRRKVTKRTVYSSDEEDVQASDEFTFEQMKDISDKINDLTGDDLTTVVSIIQDSMPNLSDSGQEEIVLDINALDTDTLRKLRDFVYGKPAVKDKKQKARYSAKDTDTKIQELEQTLRKFDHADGYGSSSSQSDSEDDDSGSSSDSSSSESD